MTRYSTHRIVYAKPESPEYQRTHLGWQDDEKNRGKKKWMPLVDEVAKLLGRQDFSWSKAGMYAEAERGSGGAGKTGLEIMVRDAEGQCIQRFTGCRRGSQSKRGANAVVVV